MRLWVRDVCLIARLFPQSDPFQYSFIIFNIYNWASHWEELAFVATWYTFDNSSTSRLPLLFNLVLGICASDFSACSTSRHFIVELLFLKVFSRCMMGVLWRVYFFDHTSRGSRAELPSIHTQSGTQRNNFQFWWSVRHWRLLFPHPTYGKCSTPWDTQNSPRGCFSRQSLQQNLSLGKTPQCWAILPTLQCFLSVRRAEL